MGTQDGYEYEYDYYISYAESDAAWVNGFLIPILDGHGKKHHSRCQYRLGAPKIKEMESAARNSRRIFLILSPEYLSDPENEFFEFMAHEVAINQNKYPIIPIFRQKIELPLRLKFLVGLDLSSTDVEDKAIEKLLESSSLPLLENDFIEPPYPGLSKFYSEQKDYFYGREKIIRNYTQFLLDERCLFIVGASGSGKSSLVHAGILPKLLSKQYQIDGGGWLIKILEHPENKPFSKLKAILGENIAIDEYLTISNLLKENKNSQLLFFIDQLEEVFQDENNENSEFFEAILKINKLSQVYLIFTFRADFYHFLTNSEISGLAENHQKSIKALTKEELKSAIVNPALSKNVYIDPILVERLLSDAGDEPGILPFIQITMRILWKERQLRWIPLSKYEEIEDDTGSVVGLKAAISKHANSVYKELSSNECKIIAKRIFVRLIQFDDNSKHSNICRRQSVSELIGYEDNVIFDRTLKILIDRGRLLIISGKVDDENQVIDICHESLIDNWELLNNWLIEASENERKRRYYISIYRKWVSNSKRYGFLDRNQIQDTKEIIRYDQEMLGGKNKQLNFFIKESEVNHVKYRNIIYFKYFSIFIFFIFAYISYPFFINYLMLIEAHNNINRVDFSGGAYPIGMEQDTLDDKSGPKRIFEWKDFSLDRFEVTNKNYCLCVRANKCFKPDYPEIKDQQVCDVTVADQPVSNVDIYSAQVFCNWISGRLPHEIEWEHAARGFSDRRYPYTERNITAKDVHVINGHENYKKPVNQLTKDITPEGVYGLSGNVREWTISSFSFYSDMKAPVSTSIESIGDISAAKGMSFRDDYGFFHLSHRYFIESVSKVDFIGFRCAYNI